MNEIPGPLIFAPQSSLAFAAQIAQLLGVEVARSEEREFEGGEHKMRPTENVRDREVFVVQQLHGDESGSVNDRLCRLLFFVGALKDAGATRVTACLPNLAYARKDRRTQKRDPVTTRYIARLFEAVGMDRVVVLDVHNESAFDNAFRLPAIRLDGADLFARHVSARVAAENLVVVSPDIGGVKRAEEFRKVLERHANRKVGSAFMEKTRIKGEISGDLFVGDVKDAVAIVYDDLIASGSTILRAAQAARRAGAVKVHAIATHPVFSPEVRQLFTPGQLDSLTISDSIPLRKEFRSEHREFLSVCSVAPLFAELIRRLHARLPIDDLTVCG